MAAPGETLIQPERSWFSFDFRELLRYRDLLYLLVRKNFILQYKQTVLGYAWLIIQPLLTTLIFTAVFAHTIKVSTDGAPPVVFYLCGLLIWSFFVRCLTSVSDFIFVNAAMFDTVYFPRLIVPVSLTISSFWTYIIQLTVFLGVGFYFSLQSAAAFIPNTASLLLLPLLLIQTAMIGFGVGLWLAIVTAKYRDIRHLIGFITQLWFYVTPVIYPSSIIPQKWLPLMLTNPMALMVECHRFIFLGMGSVPWSSLGLSLGLSFLILSSAVMVFNKIEHKFVDTF